MNGHLHVNARDYSQVANFHLQSQWQVGVEHIINNANKRKSNTQRTR